MRYIGNKENLIDKIYHIMKSKNIHRNSFFDFFSGTTSVARYFKRLDYQVFSSDILYFSYVLQQAYIVNNHQLKFEKILDYLSLKNHSLFSSPLHKILEYLNQIETVEGFIFQNYTPIGTAGLEMPRMYYSDQNGKRIDAIRQRIESWKKDNLIGDSEYYVLLACLIETVPFEVRIVELLNNIITSKHLSGGNRPEIIGYYPDENPDDCIIMDSKAYANGFSIPANERDKMIRYISEYNSKDESLNSNKWWENLNHPYYPLKEIKYSFVSSSFTGQYLNQINYIKQRTTVNGSAITTVNLLKKVDSVMGNINGYNIESFFNELGSNQLVS